MEEKTSTHMSQPKYIKHCMFADTREYKVLYVSKHKSI